MIIGVPKELKDNENRVALLPREVARLRRSGHPVLLQRGAGLGSGYEDTEYQRAGAKLISSIRDVYRKSDLLVKVKEPTPEEFQFFREGLKIFCYLHLAANPQLTRALLCHGVIALGFETLENSLGETPLLKPMSEIAGRLSVLLGAHYLQKNHGGRGVLLSHTHFSEPGHVVVIGGGSVGRAAAEVAAGLGARVTVLDIRVKPLRNWAGKLRAMRLRYSSSSEIRKSLREADLVIGAVYVHGAKAPKVIRREMVKGMPKGSVLMDVAVDQGGASETTRPTTISNPIYLRHGVVHCAITNMPALVSRTASQALSRTILPYVLKVARTDVKDYSKDRELLTALNIIDGRVVHPGIK